MSSFLPGSAPPRWRGATRGTLCVVVALCLAPLGCLRVGFDGQRHPVQGADGDIRDADLAVIDEPQPDSAPTLDADVVIDGDSEPDGSDADLSVPDGDAEGDAPEPTCPGDTAPFLDAGRSSCIELVERPADLWINAEVVCSDLGRRLCSDVEWVAACHAAPSGLETMTDSWEWVADLQSVDNAFKRGSTSCDSQSYHDIDSGGYTYQCCDDPS